MVRRPGQFVYREQESAALQTSRGWRHQHEPFQLSVEEYVRFREQGYLVVRNLVPQTDVEELVAHTEDLMAGKVTVPGVPPPPTELSPAERRQYYLRIHMLHRCLEEHERFMLHPRVLDVLKALIGPDVLALQTMFFLKGPGGAGQGYHQDSYWIPTAPDTLCGAWLALDRADEENGCLWMTVGSQHEPIYPAVDPLPSTHQGNPGNLRDLTPVRGIDHTDTSVNELTRVAARYGGREVPVIADPGDVVFFGGHILHRSHANRSAHRFRRAFVSHYCNARSYTEWGGGNQNHILARGDMHLPFAKPKYGTHCAAMLSPEERRSASPAGASMMGSADGMMGMGAHGDEKDHQH